MLHNLISLQTISFFSSLCVQTIYLHFFVFANNFLKNFPSPLQKKNGPSLNNAFFIDWDFNNYRTGISI
jgi:hypothetical protein